MSLKLWEETFLTLNLTLGALSSKTKLRQFAQGSENTT